MKRVIDGKVYNTETASRICAIPSYSDNRSDFQWDDTDLYKSPRGTFFLAGEGGPISMWSIRDSNGWRSGSGIRIVTELDARGYAEASNLKPEAYERAFGAVEVG